MRKTQLLMIGGAFLFSASVLAGPFFIEDARVAMPELDMPDSQISIDKREKLMDSDPRSRSELVGFIKNHQGFEWENLSYSPRAHILFDKDSVFVSKKYKKDIESLMEKAEDGSHIVISGFADEEGEQGYNRELSKKRAVTVKNIVEKINTKNQKTNIQYTVLSSLVWPGDPINSRRSDILILK